MAPSLGRSLVRPVVWELGRGCPLGRLQVTPQKAVPGRPDSTRAASFPGWVNSIGRRGSEPPHRQPESQGRVTDITPQWEKVRELAAVF